MTIAVVARRLLAQILEFVRSLRSGWGERLTRVDKFIGTLKNLATIALAIGAYIYAWGGHTHTSCKVAEATRDVIKLNVTTVAPPQKVAYVREFTLSFGALPIEGEKLRLQDSVGGSTSVVISPDKPMIITLTPDGLIGKCRKRFVDGAPDRFTKKEIISRKYKGYVTLTVYVQESSDGDYERHKVIATFRADELDLFIDHYLPEDIPVKSC